jgi:hypothetical protein
MPGENQIRNPETWRDTGDLVIAEIGNWVIEKLLSRPLFNYPITNFGNYQISPRFDLSPPRLIN